VLQAALRAIASIRPAEEGLAAKWGTAWDTCLHGHLATVQNEKSGARFSDGLRDPGETPLDF
jgi:hypothetical protein